MSLIHGIVRCSTYTALLLVDRVARLRLLLQHWSLNVLVLREILLVGGMLLELAATFTRHGGHVGAGGARFARLSGGVTRRCS